MATLQIYAKNNTHSDPEVDARFCWKRGDIVGVYADGVCTEPPAPGSPTVFIHLPGVSVEQVNRHVGKEREAVLVSRVTYSGELDEFTRFQTKRRRAFRLVWGDLPQSVRDAIISNREYTFTGSLQTLKTYIVDLRTGLREA